MKTEKEKEKYKEEARKKAEEINDFQKERKKEFDYLKQQHEKCIKDKDKKYDLLQALKDCNERQKLEAHQREVSDLVKCVSDNKDNLKQIHEVLMKHENKIKCVKCEEEKETLLKKQEKELSDLIKDLLKQIKQKEEKKGQSKWSCVLS